MTTVSKRLQALENYTAQAQERERITEIVVTGQRVMGGPFELIETWRLVDGVWICEREP